MGGAALSKTQKASSKIRKNNWKLFELEFSFRSLSWYQKWKSGSQYRKDEADKEKQAGELKQNQQRFMELHSASRPRKRCTSELESRSAHKTFAQQEKQNYDNPVESNEQRALKVDGGVAVTFSANSDADYPSDFDAGMDSKDFNSDFVSQCCNTWSQQADLKKALWMTKLWILYRVKSESVNFFQT